MVSLTLLNKGRLERFGQVNKGEEKEREKQSKVLQRIFSFNNFTAGPASISKTGRSPEKLLTFLLCPGSHPTYSINNY